jgi:chromosome segregation ATPase
MEPENLTVRILVEIRDEMRGMREDTNRRLDHMGTRIDRTNERLDQTNERLDLTNERLGAVEHAVRDMSAQMVFMGRSLGVTRSKGRRHTVRLDDLERRVEVLEKERT